MEKEKQTEQTPEDTRKSRKKKKKPEDEKSFYLRLGVSIGNFRRNAGINQAELADMLYLASNTISDIEGGKSHIKAYQLKKLCDILHVAPNKLLGYEVQEDKSIDYLLKARITEMDPDDKQKLLKLIDLVF